MDQTRSTSLATFIVIATGSLWGLYWLPVRHLADLGLGGAAGTAAITLAATLCLLPFAIRNRRRMGGADPGALIALMLGGVAFALYSAGFNYGRVAIIILLFFLTPIWSTLIARFVLGWRTPPLRLAAIAVGLAGLGTMLSADGDWPVPRTIGEWMALASGIGWALATTGLRVRPALAPVDAVCVFVASAAAASVLMSLLLPEGRSADTTASFWSLAAVALPTGALWWAASMVGLIWASTQLDPARTGILLMAEVVIGAVTAAMFAGEHLARTEVIGGALVIAAGVLEVWPARRRHVTPRAPKA